MKIQLRKAICGKFYKWNNVAIIRGSRNEAFFVANRGCIKLDPRNSTLPIEEITYEDFMTLHSSKYYNTVGSINLVRKGKHNLQEGLKIRNDLVKAINKSKY